MALHLLLDSTVSIHKFTQKAGIYRMKNKELFFQVF